MCSQVHNSSTMAVSGHETTFQRPAGPGSDDAVDVEADGCPPSVVGPWHGTAPDRNRRLPNTLRGPKKEGSTPEIEDVLLQSSR